MEKEEHVGASRTRAGIHLAARWAGLVLSTVQPAASLSSMVPSKLPPSTMMISDCLPSQRALSIASRSVAASFSVGMITDTLAGSLNSAFT